MHVSIMPRSLPLTLPPRRPQFEGRSEGEYDQLAGLAHGALGTPIGREARWLAAGCLLG